MDDVKRNIRISKNNARFKAIKNFHEENKISWLTLTLTHHNKKIYLHHFINKIKI
jgi:hypothetical protein